MQVYINKVKKLELVMKIIYFLKSLEWLSKYKKKYPTYIRNKNLYFKKKK